MGAQSSRSPRVAASAAMSGRDPSRPWQSALSGAVSRRSFYALRYPPKCWWAGMGARRGFGSVGLAVTIAVAYFLIAYLSLSGLFFYQSEGVTVFWAAAGISSGLLIGFGSRARWPVIAGVFVGAFLIPLIVLERGIWLSTIFATCDVAEPIIIAGLIARYFGDDFALDRLGKVFGFLGATIAGTTPSSLGGVVASRLFLGPETKIPTTWLHWWTGVAVGVVTVAPVIIGFSAALREPPPRSERIEGFVALLTLAAMTGVLLSLPQQLWETVVPGALLFPVLLWLAARCRPIFAAGGALIVSLTIAWTTIFDIGHFANSGLTVDFRIVQAQAVILLAAIGANVLAALFSERRESEARLVRANAMLEREQDIRLLNAQAVTAAIAHQMRQPLCSIAINAEAGLRWLGRTPPGHDEVRSALTKVKRDAHRASDVFDGIRALFGKSGWERRPIDVNRMVLSVTESLQEELNDHGVRTRHQLTAELPLVTGHEAQLKEVVFNLINNAVEAMVSTTNQSRMLWLRTEVCGRDEIMVSVEDSGPGIDPGQLEKVFDAFVSTKAHGTGLGLAICRMIVEGHGGRLTASSDGKSGALFQFILPIGSTDKAPGSP
jgi:signal transduction histidine kinase